MAETNFNKLCNYSYRVIITSRLLQKKYIVYMVGQRLHKASYPGFPQVRALGVLSFALQTSVRRN